MIDLRFAVEGVTAERRALSPTLLFTVAVSSDTPVYALVLRTQIDIEARRRRYVPDEEARLVGLFGTPDRWHDTVRSVHWADVATTIAAFETTSSVQLRVPCTADVEVGATTYLDNVDGDVPLRLLFSGTAFVDGPAGFAVVPLSRDLEATWRLPAGTWRELMGACFGAGRWVRLAPDRFDALAHYRAERALASWDATVDDVLSRIGVQQNDRTDGYLHTGSGAGAT